MAQFKPGHVHIERDALNKNDHSYDLNIEYEASQDPREGRGIQFRMHGSIEGKDVDEKFFLAKDQVLPSFLMVLSRKAQAHLPPPKKFETLSSPHKIYDAMFEDIRIKLDVKSGDPIKPEHLE
ncbi:DUF5064 domain-containing protein [Pseudomonas sp. SWI6]|uniref:DUF5064 family protein n=1 Tax=Pseudomonas taiwanensis TaxID=470150 RepID=A0ABR6V4M2_9PSED|nr:MULTISPECIES: DUF5064 family protein [Pseudomonas]AGZ36816.1 hypothetical protein PVLB_20175 [Pseudomonas sp. VLB120]AVD81847.1 DUF5064 domain-containing protein [Pseudomonas sp. SWI6]AVD88799.1 DUF5064 domain-containing protein [Pseudomonas sp. SWI44]MBC3475451.1 DUF5064 family protein [Pseudomonas taiwanensis]MBC3491059.1 DUF5064 family protein [Pseudomonas taiwanensis]